MKTWILLLLFLFFVTSLAYGQIQDFTLKINRADVEEMDESVENIYREIRRLFGATKHAPHYPPLQCNDYLISAIKELLKDIGMELREVR